MLDLGGAKCLVVGGGKVAERKVESLLECGAHVRVVSPAVSPEIEALAARGTVEWLAKEFQPDDAQGAWLVVAATDDAVVNEKVAREAQARGALINVVDCAPLSNFIVPSVLRRGDLTIAVSTAGASPAMAQHIRKELESNYGAEYARVLRLLSGLRPLVIASFPAGGPREEVFHRLASPRILNRLRAKDTNGLTDEIRAVLGVAYDGHADDVAREIAAALGTLDGKEAGEA
jgi:precorrin-2 dehydrogenase/sirohydrochlorin ferrochelatase